MNIYPATIVRILGKCKVLRSDSPDDIVTVHTVLGNDLHLSLSRMYAHYLELVSVAKRLPSALRVSNGCAGVPWTDLLSSEYFSGSNPVSLEAFLTMAITLGIVRIMDYHDIVSDFPLIAVDDKAVIRYARLKGESVNNSLTKWRKN